MGNLLASSVRESGLVGYDATAERRWRNFDVSLLLFSNFATVSPVLLPVYAEQYGVAQFVNGEAQTRAFLRRVIALYQKKGTAWAMREALAAVGYPNARIIESGSGAAAAKYNGEFKYDGTVQYGGGDWATFRVVIPLGGKPSPPATTVTLLTNIINEFKPARCRLINLTFQA